MLVHTSRVTIEWGDCDPAGIVWYPRFFGLFDGATAALFAAALGLKKAEMMAAYDMAGFPMVDTRAQFHAPCTFGDEVTIESRVTEFRRSSFDVSHRLSRSGTLDAAAGGRLKSKPIPADIVERFR